MASAEQKQIHPGDILMVRNSRVGTAMGTAMHTDSEMVYMRVSLMVNLKRQPVSHDKHEHMTVPLNFPGLKRLPVNHL